MALSFILIGAFCQYSNIYSSTDIPVSNIYQINRMVLFLSLLCVLVIVFDLVFSFGFVCFGIVCVCA